MGRERDLRRFVMNAAAEFTGPNDEAYDIARGLLDADPGIGAASEHAALVLGDVERVRTLIESEPARVDAPGGPYTDRRPLHYVTHSRFWRRDDETARGLLECARLLLDAATELRPLDAFTFACARDELAAARALLRRHPGLLVDLPPADVQGFHQLAERGRVEALATALDAGLPVDVANGEGQTPLHWAAWHGRADVVELLLRRGAALETVEREFGCTPLLWAAHGATNWPAPDGDYPRVVRLLLDAGADVTPANAWGEGAVSLAGDASDVVALLRDAGAPDRPRPPAGGC